MKAEPRGPCQVNAAYGAAPLLPHTHISVSFSSSSAYLLLHKRPPVLLQVMFAVRGLAIFRVPGPPTGREGPLGA